jgi:hypothetical protein
MISEQLKTELEAKELRCPACGEKLHTTFQRNQNLWAVTHGLGSGSLGFEGKTCPNRWTEFSRSDRKDQGGTSEQAQDRARQTTS